MISNGLASAGRDTAGYSTSRLVAATRRARRVALSTPYRLNHPKASMTPSTMISVTTLVDTAYSARRLASDRSDSGPKSPTVETSIETLLPRFGDIDTTP